MGHEGWAAAIVGSVGQDWDVERRFRVTEVALAIMWCCASAYLSYFFADCMMSRWLLNYTPPAVVIRLLTTNGLIAYITSWVLYLSGASSDPRLLLPAWISITTTLTFLYHATQNHATIKRETAASLLVVSIASFVSMSSLLLQLHLTRENEPEVPLFVLTRKLWDCAVNIVQRMRIANDLVGEL
ncbi:N-glycosylation protein-domain-containing protein [Aspergillus cavernicola]|uniref:N-glycosylation protein-domain-containing protein n=1 Tax=Aspergillus cavernicola TaxID=176166 RepID=A0ABR4ITZ4_9EURO